MSQQFSKRPKVLIENKFHVHINVYYKTLNAGSCFRLKCFTLMSLISNRGAFTFKKGFCSTETH